MCRTHQRLLSRTPHTATQLRYKTAGSHGFLQHLLCVQVTSTAGARAEQVTGPPSPFEGLQDEDGWWANNERTHMQRLQEQEKQRATQLRHTRAWAESQVRSPQAGLSIGSSQHACLDH